MQRLDRITGVVFFFISLGICFEAIRLSLGTFQRPGPGFFPFISGIIIGLFSFILYIKNRKKEKDNGNFWEVGADKKGILLTISALVIYGLSFEVLGFMVSSNLFFIFIIRAITRRGWMITICVAFFSSSAAYLLFEIWLKVQLPRGILM